MRGGSDVADRIVILRNFIPPYFVPVFKALDEAVKERSGKLRILISTPMESNRPWPAEWGSLPVEVQRTFTFSQSHKHPHGFTEPFFVHVPVDTLWRLWLYRPDVVNSGEMGMRTVQAAIYRLLRPQSRLILGLSLSEHTEKGRGRAREVLRRWLLHRADAVQVPGESGARYVRRFGVRGDKIFRVPNATDPAFLRTPRSARDPTQIRRLLYVGRLVELKGLVPFLRVLSRWCEQNPEREIELWFAGDGPLRPTLEPLQTDSLSFDFLGNVPYERLPDVYARVDALIFPTLADEWGLVVNEAMAAGVPVLGSLYSQAVEEMVVDGVNGWTFHPDRPTEVFAALDRALQTSPRALEALRKAATSRALDLSPERMADRYLKAISFVMSSPRT